MQKFMGDRSTLKDVTGGLYPSCLFDVSHSKFEQKQFFVFEPLECGGGFLSGGWLMDLAECLFSSREGAGLKDILGEKLFQAYTGKDLMDPAAQELIGDGGFYKVLVAGVDWDEVVVAYGVVGGFQDFDFRVGHTLHPSVSFYFAEEGNERTFVEQRDEVSPPFKPDGFECAAVIADVNFEASFVPVAGEMNFVDSANDHYGLFSLLECADGLRFGFVEVFSGEKEQEVACAFNSSLMESFKACFGEGMEF